MNTRRITVTQALIIINSVIFLLCLMGKQELFDSLFAYTWAEGVAGGQFWRIITYEFLHANFGHVLFNMWALYFFGRFAEDFFGPKKFLVYYLVCGAAGALFSSLLAGLDLYTTHFEYAGQLVTLPWQQVPLVGASASVYGVMVAVAFLAPDARISLLFPPIDMKMRTFALVVIGIAAATVLFNWSNAGGEAGHLGGIIMAALIMTILKLRGDLNRY